MATTKWATERRETIGMKKKKENAQLITERSSNY